MNVMKTFLSIIARVSALALVVIVGVMPPASAQSGNESVPLYDDLGDYHFEISTSVDLAQRYFDQGIRLYYAFNHAEAIRAFHEAQQLDPGCAICWWAEALAWGPNINLAMDTPSANAAFAAIDKAVQKKAGASTRERTLINALAARYTQSAPENRAHLDQAYADAMAQVATSYPDDLDVEKQGQTTVLLRSLSPGKPNRLNVVCPRFTRFTPGRAPPQIGLFDVT